MVIWVKRNQTELMAESIPRVQLEVEKWPVLVVRINNIGQYQ